MHRIAIIILNYRTPEMTIECLNSVVPQVGEKDCAIVVDNASNDDSADTIESYIESHGWDQRVQVIRCKDNGGFACGNNVGMRAVQAQLYLLLNSDTIVCEGAIDSLVEHAATNPADGIVGPCLQWPDGTQQISRFRYRTPLREFARAASTTVVSRLIPRGDVGLATEDQDTEVEWTSFACALLRRDMVREIGLLDSGFFMYFEDIDYCRRAREAGWTIGHCPGAHVVHLRGGTSPVKRHAEHRRRLPRYYYQSRARYFTKYYGRTGLWITNALWLIGFGIACIKQLVGGSLSHVCEREWMDNWIDAFHVKPQGTSETASSHATT